MDAAYSRAIDQQVGVRLKVLNHRGLYKILLIALPIATSLVSLLGGLLTVYASTDCEGTDFKGFCRAFLYTSLTYTMFRTVSAAVISATLSYLIDHPHIATAAFMTQTVVTACFFLALSWLLFYVYSTSCQAVREKAKKALV